MTSGPSRLSPRLRVAWAIHCMLRNADPVVLNKVRELHARTNGAIYLSDIKRHLIRRYGWHFSVKTLAKKPEVCGKSRVDFVGRLRDVSESKSLLKMAF